MFVNAVVDALKDFGVRHNDMPLTTLQLGERGCGKCGASTDLSLYGNPWFSVQAVACTEIISFPYTPSDLDPSSSNFRLIQAESPLNRACTENSPVPYTRCPCCD